MALLDVFCKTFIKQISLFLKYNVEMWLLVESHLLLGCKQVTAPDTQFLYKINNLAFVPTIFFQIPGFVCANVKAYLTCSVTQTSEYRSTKKLRWSVNEEQIKKDKRICLGPINCHINESVKFVLCR